MDVLKQTEIGGIVRDSTTTTTIGITNVELRHLTDTKRTAHTHRVTQLFRLIHTANTRIHIHKQTALHCHIVVSYCFTRTRLLKCHSVIVPYAHRIVYCIAKIHLFSSIH